MGIAQNLVGKLSTISEELKGLTIEAVFSKNLIDENKKSSINSIKSEIYQASNVLDDVNNIDNEQMQVLESVVNECMDSLSQIHSNMKQDLIQQHAEDEYAELSARMHYLYEQIERIKDN